MRLPSQSPRKTWSARGKGVLKLFLPEMQLLIKANLYFSFDGLNMRGIEVKAQNLSTTQI